MDYIKKLLYVSPVAIGLIYLLIGFLWIGFSDQIVFEIFEDPETITAVQTYKGWGFVAVSSVFIYFLILINNNKLGNVIEEKQAVQKEFEAIIEQAPVGIVYHNQNEKWLRVNQLMANMLGYSKSELLEMEFKDFIHPGDLEAGRDLDRELIDGTRTSYKTEKKYLKKDGTHLIGRLSKAIIDNKPRPSKYMLAIVEDITRQKEVEEELKKTVHEKELLLAEVLHRVNNNLALIMGFLELEHNNIDNEECRVLFKKSQMRIKSIGIIHEKLYQANDFSNLPLDTYVREILSTVSKSWANGTGHVSYTSNAGEVKLNVNQAIPCGLIINELVTNAYKHAFPGSAAGGEVRVDIKAENDLIVLTVSDNGIGLPDTLDFEEANTLGFTIVNILSKKLEADVDMNTRAGTSFTITFKAESDKRGSASNL